MLEENELLTYVGRDIVDRYGKQIGYVDTIFNDEETGEPQWIGVLAGVFRQHNHLVPAAAVEPADGALKVPFSKRWVTHAPTYDKEDRTGMLGLGSYRLAISKEKEREAYAYYDGLSH